MTNVLFSRVSIKYVKVPITATDIDGDLTAPGDLRIALLPFVTGPDETTEWTTSSLDADGALNILVAGPSATVLELTDPFLLLPVAGGVLWVANFDNPEVDPKPVATFSFG